MATPDISGSSEEPSTPATSVISSPSSLTPKPLRLLCFDGGGVRGLASLYVLKQCLAYVGDPKPCEFFDMIAGSSTGGLIALMLGRLEMTVQECINQWVILMREVFKRKLTTGMSIFGKVKARYDGKVLEAGIKRIIRGAGYSEEALLRGEKLLGSKCKTFVVAVAHGSSRPTIFSDWKRMGEGGEIFDTITIWEAARATSAAPLFFDPIVIKNSGIPETYIDGAMSGDNNPVNRLWNEANRAFEPPVPLRIRALVSIGTGQPRQKEFGRSVLEVSKSIAAMAVNTEQTHLNFQTGHSELDHRDAYWRFNPPDIHEDVKLAEFEKAEIISTRTNTYGEHPDQIRRYENFGRIAALGEDTKCGRTCNPAKRTGLIRVIAPPRFISKGYTRLFYQLGGGSDHFVREQKYWAHLTVNAYLIYEKIYDFCRDRDGFVHFNDFIEQFRPDSSNSKPNRSQVELVWRRLIRDPRQSASATPHDKGFVLAILYMLHIELVSPTEKPHDENGATGVNVRRRDLLKKWPNWVPCSCDCGLLWNFANDIGMHLPGRPKHPCRVAKWVTSRSTATKDAPGAELNRASQVATLGRWVQSRFRD